VSNMTGKDAHFDEAFFRNFYENCFDAVLLLKSDGTIISANPSACTMLAMSEDEIRIAGSDGIILGERSEPSRTGDQRSQTKFTFRRKGGTAFVGDTISSQFEDHQGNLRECLIVRELSGRSEPDDSQSSRNEQKRFYQILSSMPYGILLVTDEGWVEFVNQGFCDTFGLADRPSDLKRLPENEILSRIRSSYADPNAAVALIREIVKNNRPVASQEVALSRERTVLRDFIPLRLGGKESGRLWIHVDITGLKKAERNLKESEELFFKAFHGSPAALVVIRVSDNRYVDVNETFVSLLEYGRDEVIGYTSKELNIYPRYDERERLVAMALDQDNVRNREMEVRTKSGRLRNVLLSLETMTIHGQRHILATIVDITDMKRAQTKVAESEAKYRDLFETVQEVFYIDRLVYGEGGKVVDWIFEDMNPAGFRLLGLDDMTGAIGKRGSEVLGPETASFYLPMIEEARRTGKAVTFQYLSPAVDRVFLSSYVVHDDRLITAQMDITDIKKAQRAVEESEAKYRGLFQAVQESLFITRLIYDDQGNVVDWINEDVNPSGLEALGLSSLDQVKGKLGSEALGHARVKFFLPRIEKARRSGEAEVFEYHSQITDRDYINMSVVNGDQYIASQMDITDVKKAQHQAEEYSRKLERSNEELQHFAYVASHDLQEPLRMVISYLTLLQRKFQGSIDDEAQHYIDFAVDGGSRMRHLIDDLLEYSRVETKGKGFVPVDMNKLVARTLAIVKDPAEKSGADIIVDSLPTIVADESQMIQVMQNLIGNAIKFHGPERPMIHVTASIESGEWKFAVRDNGIGMDIKHSDRIFQMFQRLHTKEEYPGTGVGLAIAKKIIERHGGRIWVESDEGKGTVFFFTIPAIHQDSRTQ
jgi:PAS domain S-box-containing protein